ncbi:sphingomyelin phosphodiesterase [Agromyces sp. Root81]|uniref:sphingomyelin phosphodiesterase n=1 Tax=Agromyces sp. Root81 TaxID=1736601 RepID=UPI0006F7E7D2|nr:sphingomyelin phosphodiesterase [Agromyces sp. Root81]KRC62041.1 sphingomyelin phosphodiesterase [Agromyces sp. Root81]
MPSTSHTLGRVTAVCAAATLALLTAFAAASPAAAAPAETTESAPAGSASVPPLDVLSYNVFLMSKHLYPNWGQDHRAEAIAAADFFQGHDVVVLQEAFDNGASDLLASRASAAYPYQTPVVGRSMSGWDATGGNYSAATPEDGGVALYSTWPIIRQEQWVFKEACGADWFANKGFVYAELDVDGLRTHVIGTHLQSTDPGCSTGQPATVRAAQLQTITRFIDSKNIPADEPVVIAGDLNVDSRSSEYPSLLANAVVAPATERTGWPYSFDTAENSIAAYRYPTDPREDLDYILYRADHARPAEYTNEVRRAETAPWTVTSWFTDYTYDDLSDHYPVIGR